MPDSASRTLWTHPDLVGSISLEADGSIVGGSEGGPYKIEGDVAACIKHLVKQLDAMQEAERARSQPIVASMSLIVSAVCQKHGVPHAAERELQDQLASLLPILAGA